MEAVRLNKFTTALLYLITVSTILLAVRWIILDSPWLLDQRANEANLGLGSVEGTMSFDQWFGEMSNPEGAQKYIYTIYRFFGTWMLGLGLSWLVMVYFSRKNSALRYVTLTLMGFVLALVYFFEYSYIWVSIYVPLSFILGILWLVALGLQIRVARTTV